MATGDIAHSLVDDRLAKLDKRLAREYTKALRDLRLKLNDYLKQYKINDEKMRRDWLSGKITLTDYKNWRQNRILDATRYTALVRELSHDLTNTNRIANNIIYNSLGNSYLDAANYTAYEIETAVGGSVNFTLYSKEAVGELLKDNARLLPALNPAREAEIAQKGLQWNMIKVNSAITQGILQGESIGKIANRLQMVTDMNRSTALRNARTLHNYAENKGREDSYKQASDLGIEVEREWLAVHDNRTRDAHRELDGQIRPRGVPFENSIGKIRFPSDPQAAPANVYNCRCQTRGVLPKYPYETDRYSKKGYEEWKKGKKNFTKYLQETGNNNKYGRF